MYADDVPVDGDSGGVNTNEAMNLVTTYQESELWRGVEEKLQTLSDNRKSKRGGNGGGTYATNFVWQLMIVSLRSLVNLLRNPIISFFQVRLRNSACKGLQSKYHSIHVCTVWIHANELVWYLHVNVPMC